MRPLTPRTAAPGGEGGEPQAASPGHPKRSRPTVAIVAVFALVATAVAGGSPAWADEPADDTLSGVVTIEGPDGPPAEGVTVDAIPTTCGWFFCPSMVTTTTDSDGGWEFSGLPAADYRVRFSAAEYRTTWVGGRNDREAEVFTIGGMPAVTGLATWVWGVDIPLRGYASVRETREVLAGIRVDLHLATAPTDSAPAYTTHTTPDGTWGLRVAPGIYRVHFTDPTGTYPDAWAGAYHSWYEGETLHATFGVEGPLGADEFWVDDEHVENWAEYRADAVRASQWEAMARPNLVGVPANGGYATVGQGFEVDPGLWEPTPDEIRCEWASAVGPYGYGTQFTIPVGLTGEIYAICTPLKNGYAAPPLRSQALKIVAELPEEPEPPRHPSRSSSCAATSDCSTRTRSST
ncbi:carboxypeptidase-like regulatory domain-containing protein [Agromyces protaetiae]|nr:carboxypeptidase-like regulatory domain-containing protein [Agromyces protaetiae]